MENYMLRPYNTSDASAVAELINASSLKTVGFPRAVVDSVGNLWAYRFVPPSSQKVVATSNNDHIVGYAYFTGKDDNLVGEIGASVHPKHMNSEVGGRLMEWADNRAKEASAKAPQGLQTVLQMIVYENEQSMIKLLEAHGYTPVREWVHLVVELEEPPVVPALPPNLTLREMDLENDWDIVGPAMDEAYADHWGTILPGSYEPMPQEHTEADESEEDDTPDDSSYSNSPGYCFVAVDGETVAGGILCNAKLVERADTGRVGSLFVRPRYRRQGIARALMLTAFNAFWKSGLHRIITDTDAKSFTNAPSLYQNLGMKPYRREFTYEKQIRAGREVRLLG